MGGWEGQERDIERVLYKELSSLSLIRDYKAASKPGRNFWQNVQDMRLKESVSIPHCLS